MLYPPATVGGTPEAPLRMPKIGDTVIFFFHEITVDGKNKHPNGHRNHPAIVTNVWSERCVNLKVLPDCADLMDKTSCNLRETPDGTNNPNEYWEWPE